MRLGNVTSRMRLPRKEALLPRLDCAVGKNAARRTAEDCSSLSRWSSGGGVCKNLQRRAGNGAKRGHTRPR